MNRFAKIIAVASLALISGCVNVFPKPPQPAQRVTIEPKATATEALQQVDWQLAIEEPSAYSTLNSTKINVRKFSNNGFPVFEHVHGKEWIDRLPAMLQAQMVNYLQRSSKFSGVSRTSDGLKPNYILVTNFQDFQIEYPEADAIPNIHISLSVQLLAMPNRKIVAMHHFENQQPAAGTGFAAILSAFGDSYGAILDDLARWLTSFTDD